MTGTARREWGQHWTVVLAAAAGMSLASLSALSFGVMVVPIERDLHWTRAAIASGPALITLMVFTLGTLLGRLVDRFGPRAIGIGAVVIVCGALALMSRIGAELWQWWACWALVGLGSSVMPTVWLKPVSSRFDAGRGMAIAVVLCGSGITSFLAPILANTLVEHHGWRTAYLAMAGLWCAIVLPLVLLFLRGAGGSAGAHALPTDRASEGLTAREVLASAKFYRLLLAALASTFLGAALTLNLVPILRATGLSGGSAARAAGLLGFSMIGRFASGWLLDRIDARVIAAGACLIMLLLPVALLALPGSMPAAMAAVVAYGLMGGALIAATAYLASRHFGGRCFGMVYGTINAIHSLGAGLGPLMTSYLFDRTGSYHLALIAAVPLFVVAAALFGTLGTYPTFAEER